MKKTVQIISALLIIFAFVACSSKNYDKEMRVSEETFYKGKYLEAARLLLPNVNKAGKDELLFMMECGLMLHTGEDYKTSNKILLRAGSQANLIPISVTQQVSTLLTNDTNANYRGEDFERVLIHVYLGINFLMLEQYDSARVEFMAVNNELSKIKSENGEARYKQNLMAKYLTAIAFEIAGEKDKDTRDIEFAYIEYKQVYALDPSIAMVKDDLLRVSSRLGYDDDYLEWKSKFKKSYTADENSGELVTIFQAGRSAIKKSRGSLLKDPDMGPAIRLTINGSNLTAGLTAAAILVTLNNAENPIAKFEKRSNKVDKVRIETGGISLTTTMLEDVETTALKNLEDDYSRLYVKVAASIATKTIATLASGIAAKKIAEQFKQTKGFASLIGTAVGAGTGAALFSSMKPDLRCWHTLPANFQLGRVRLKPGKHTVSFAFMGGGGIVDRQEKEVEIKKGEKKVVNLRTLY